MVAGGKPLWYIQIFTTVSAFILTIFFMSVCMNWSSGLDGMPRPDKYPWDDWDTLKTAGFVPFREKLQGSLLWFNLGSGLLTTLGGSLFAYVLYQQKIK